MQDACKFSGGCMACGLETCAGPSARRALHLYRFYNLHPEQVTS